MKAQKNVTVQDQDGNSTKPLLQDGFMQFNVNNDIYVKLTEKGIEKYVRDTNNIMPFKMQISYREFESRRDEQGYHRFQMWSFVDSFGDLGMQGWQYYDTNVLFKANDMETVL